MYEKIRLFLAECSRSNYDRIAPGISTLTVAHRDDLLFNLSRVETADRELHDAPQPVGGSR